ncbi:MAG TPA: hypothetical protein VJT73_06215 [Polyangiaceae bacterium]|nr:hypothetical protein [Polyangiaceae bacterium]
MRWAVQWGFGLSVLAPPLALVFSACGSDSLVGGTCRAGLSECGLACIDLNRDQNNCGVCGRVCSDVESCISGICELDDDKLRKKLGLRDGSADGDDGVGAASDAANDGALGDGNANPDVSVADGGATDGHVGEGGTSDAGEAGSGCIPPYNTAAQCGDCDTKCGGATPVCGLQGTYKCLPQCESPLEACGAECVDKFSDEKHCGDCSIACASGICQAGKCVGAGFGHQIAIGMDYTDSTLSDVSAQLTLLANALLLPNRASVRVLAYDEFADAGTVTRINGFLGSIASTKGRTLTFSLAGKAADTWKAIPAMLAVATYDVLLVYDQSSAPTDQMATTGTLWNGAVDSFAKGGGVVVALDGGSPGKMIDFLTNSGLLAVTDEVDVVGTQLKVDAPTDGVGVGLPNVFIGKKSSIAFVTTQVPDNRHVFVVKDNAGVLPVVVHSVP